MPQILPPVKATLRAPAAALTVAAVCPPIPEIEAKEQTKALFHEKNVVCLRGRVKGAGHPEYGVHGLMILNEPDAWMVNLLTKTG